MKIVYENAAGFGKLCLRFLYAMLAIVLCVGAMRVYAAVLNEFCPALRERGVWTYFLAISAPVVVPAAVWLGLEAYRNRNHLRYGKRLFNRRRYPEAMREFEFGAKAGDTEAAMLLGDMFLNGEGTAVDYGQALKWYGEFLSNFRVNRFFQDAPEFRLVAQDSNWFSGPAHDSRLVESWMAAVADKLEQIAASGHAEAYEPLSEICCELERWERFVECRREIARAQPTSSNRIYLASVLINGKNALKENVREGESLLEALREEGDVTAEWLLAILNIGGKGERRLPDIEKGMRYFAAAIRRSVDSDVTHGRQAALFARVVIDNGLQGRLTADDKRLILALVEKEQTPDSPILQRIREGFSKA